MKSSQQTGNLVTHLSDGIACVHSWKQISHVPDGAHESPPRHSYVEAILSIEK